VGCFLSRKTAPGISKNELTSELNKFSISSIWRLNLLQPPDETVQEVANLVTFVENDGKAQKIRKLQKESDTANPNAKKSAL
jgi:hypothetical protein